MQYSKLSPNSATQLIRPFSKPLFFSANSATHPMGPLDNKVKEPLTYIIEIFIKHRVMLLKSFGG